VLLHEHLFNYITLNKNSQENFWNEIFENKNLFYQLGLFIEN